MDLQKLDLPEFADLPTELRKMVATTQRDQHIELKLSRQGAADLADALDLVAELATMRFDDGTEPKPPKVQ